MDWYSVTDYIADKFAKAGYELSKIVYRNVNAHNDTFHADKNNSIWHLFLAPQQVCLRLLLIILMKLQNNLCLIS